MVGAMIVALMLSALVVDGGFAWAQERITQNASDAASEAGAVVLAEKMTLDSYNLNPTHTPRAPAATTAGQAEDSKRLTMKRRLLAQVLVLGLAYEFKRGALEWDK